MRRSTTAVCVLLCGLAMGAVRVAHAADASLHGASAAAEPALPASAPATQPDTSLITQPITQPTTQPLTQPITPTQTRWEGAIGFTANYRPEYSGSSRNIGKISPALFLRYGRFTITNASGFVTRRADDVVRGLGVDLTSGNRFRANVALRVDRGRGENSSDALTGLGDIKPTIRGRLNLGWKLDGPFRLGSTWSWDLLGKGGGYFGDISAGLEHRFPEGRNTVINSYVVLSAAGDRYMQTYYGVNEAQAARTQYPVYEARSGLRDIGWSMGFRTDLSQDWVFIGGAGLSRLLGPAAHSPLTAKRNGWGVNSGLAWRF